MHKKTRISFRTFTVLRLSQISRPLSTASITVGTYVCYCTRKRISSRIDVRVYFPITDRSIANPTSLGARIRRFSRYPLARRMVARYSRGRRGRGFCIVKEHDFVSDAVETSKIMKWHCSRDERSRCPATSRKFWKAVSEKLASGQSPLRRSVRRFRVNFKVRSPAPSQNNKSRDFCIFFPLPVAKQDKPPFRLKWSIQ